MIFSMLFNAFLFAFFYARLARVDSRGAQVILSDKAIMTVVNGQVRFQVRVFDVDASNPVIEAHVRMYAVTKSRPVPRQLRVSQPNDELGGMLFLSVPTVFTHQVDIYSTLHPPKATPVNPSGIILRQADSAIGSREEFVCPICGESYGTHERWRNHVKFQRVIEEKDGYPIVGTHLSLQESEFMPDFSEKYSATLDIDELKEYFAKEISEVICVVEGIEPISSGTFSSLQSYMFQDIVFKTGAHFRPCLEAVDSDKGDKSCMRADLHRFHGIDIDSVETIAGLGSPVGNQSMRSHDSFFF